MAKVLNTRIWKKKYIYRNPRIQKLLVPILVFGLTYFSILKLLSPVFVWIPFFLVILFYGLVFSAFYNELDYYFNTLSKWDAYENHIRDVIDEFLRGNNYFRSDFERVILENHQELSPNYLKDFFSLDNERKTKTEENNYLKILDRLNNEYYYQTHLKSNLDCGRIQILLGAVLLLSYLPFPFYDIFYVPLIWIVPGLIFLYLESWDVTSQIFYFLDYEPSGEYQKNVMIPRILTYCKEMKIDVEEFLLIMKHNSPKYIHIQLMLKKYLDSVSQTTR